MNLRTSLALAVSGFALSACVTVPTPPQIGAAPADIPPKLVIDKTDNKSLTWDRMIAFGPVPASEQARGEKVCSTLNRDNLKFRPIGYHPRAQDLNGKAFEGGAFACFL